MMFINYKSEMIEYSVIKVRGWNRWTSLRNCSINIVQDRINHPQKLQNLDQPKQPQTFEKMTKENRDIKMNATRSSVIKNDPKKPFVTKASDNHTSETCIAGVYTPLILRMLWPHVLQLNLYTYIESL